MAKAKQKAKAKAKAGKVAKAAKVATKAESPDWLRKAMAIPPKRKGRPPGSTSRIEPTPKRGRKPMTSKSHYDPVADPDLKAPEPALITPAPPKPDQTLPKADKDKATPLVGERVVEAAPLYDEVQSGAEIPDENIQMLIAGTLGGSGDHHASAKRIVERMHQALWVITKELDDGNIDALSAKGKKGKTDTSIKPDDRKDDEDARHAKS